jgi:septum site-determining protein MinD
MALARLGHKTLLVDADVELRNLDLFLSLENRVIYTGQDVLNKTCRLKQALIQDKRQPQLTFFPLCLSQSKSPFIKSQIQELINLVSDKYDFVLIDNPAGIDQGF